MITLKNLPSSARLALERAGLPNGSEPFTEEQIGGVITTLEESGFSTGFDQGPQKRDPNYL